MDILFEPRAISLKLFSVSNIVENTNLKNFDLGMTAHTMLLILKSIYEIKDKIIHTHKSKVFKILKMNTS